VDRADPSGMAGAPSFEKIERFGPDEVQERGDAVLGAQGHEVRRMALKLARIFDYDLAVGGLRRLGEQHTESVVLPVEVPPATRTLRRFSMASRKTIACSGNMIPAAT